MPKRKLYAITNNKLYIDRFLNERNTNCFKLVITKCDKDEWDNIIQEDRRYLLTRIPLENSDGDFEIIGTMYENNILDRVSEKMADTCETLKLHFVQNVPFNMEYKMILEDLCTVSKNIDNHAIIQIDSVKLFFALFKETFVDLSEENDTSEDNDMIEYYRLNS